MDMNDDPPEVQDLERAAEWRLSRVDQDPHDSESAEAAALLQRLANELRPLQGSSLYRELGAICNWLAESDDISDFAQRAHDYPSASASMYGLRAARRICVRCWIWPSRNRHSSRGRAAAAGCATLREIGSRGPRLG